ncbi:MAG: flavin reductase family protein [Actinomycetota bacterium]
MAVSEEEFRDALKKFPSGVTVVTVADDDRLHGMTASSFASVSLIPPLILVCLDKTSHTRSLMTEGGSFAVNVLGAGQEEASRAFAQSGEKPFDALGYRTGKLGSPLLEGAIAWLECRATQVVDGGDHDIIIGEVLESEVTDGTPLVYYDRGYRSLKDG